MFGTVMKRLGKATSFLCFRKKWAINDPNAFLHKPILQGCLAQYSVRTARADTGTVPAAARCQRAAAGTTSATTAPPSPCRPCGCISKRPIRISAFRIWSHSQLEFESPRLSLLIRSHRSFFFFFFSIEPILVWPLRTTTEWHAQFERNDS